MGILNDAYAIDMQFTFADEDIFGERCTYTRGATGVQSSFVGVPFRNPASPVQNAGKPASPSPSLQFQIPYNLDPTLGLSSPPIANSDLICLANSSNGGFAKTDHAITRILSQDAGGWLVELR